MNKILVITILLMLVVWYVNQSRDQLKIIPKQASPVLKSNQSTQTNFPNSELDYQKKYSELLKFSQDFLKVVGYSSYQELEKGVKEFKKKALVQNKPTPKLTSDKETQTDNLPSISTDDQLLESTLTNLIASMKELNKSI